MTQKDNILQELRELKSILANAELQNIYSVPEGYFDGLAAQVLNRIKAMEAATSVEELSFLSPMLANVTKQLPYSVPPGYFEGLAGKAIQSVQESNDYQTAKEELETLSPLLSGLQKQMPYAVPQGYFETLSGNINTEKNKPVTKVVSITSHKWLRYAAAAVITVVITLGGFLYVNSRNHFDPVEQPYAWVKKSIQKVNTNDIDAFVKLADEQLPNQTVVLSTPVKPDEIKELMKDVSDKEIQDFLNDTPDTENSDETMMN